MVGVKAARLWHLLGTKANTATRIRGSVGKAGLTFAYGSGPGRAESGAGRCVERDVFLHVGVLLSYQRNLFIYSSFR